jgi:hypothetical protein
LNKNRIWLPFFYLGIGIFLQSCKGDTRENPYVFISGPLVLTYVVSKITDERKKPIGVYNCNFRFVGLTNINDAEKYVKLNCSPGDLINYNDLAPKGVPNSGGFWYAAFRSGSSEYIVKDTPIGDDLVIHVDQEQIAAASVTLDITFSANEGSACKLIISDSNNHELKASVDVPPPIDDNIKYYVLCASEVFHIPELKALKDRILSKMPMASPLSLPPPPPPPPKPAPATLEDK